MGTFFIWEACLYGCAWGCCPGYRAAFVWVYCCQSKTSDEDDNGQMSFSDVFLFFFSPKKP